MIPRANITAWRGNVPWSDDAQVEQDLVLSRAIVELFVMPELADGLALRGGTAIQKLFLAPPVRYSEDVDLVQRRPGPIGLVLDHIRAALDPWLNEPRRKRGPQTVTLVYRFDSEALPVRRLRLKIEINTREHFSVHPIEQRRLVVTNPWFTGAADVPTFGLNELFGTKLRALYQRKKGRDLFDLWLALDRGLVDADTVVECFCRYMEHGGATVSRAEYAANLAEKLADPAFAREALPLLSPAAAAAYDPERAASVVTQLIARVPGDPWKGDGAAT